MRKEELLNAYQEKIKQNLLAIDNAPITNLFDSVLMGKELSPINKKESMQLTKNLINYIICHQIFTMEECIKRFKRDRKSILKRISILKKYSLVRRLDKRNYTITPKLKKIKLFESEEN